MVESKLPSQPSISESLSLHAEEEEEEEVCLNVHFRDEATTKIFVLQTLSLELVMVTASLN